MSVLRYLLQLYEVFVLMLISKLDYKALPEKSKLTVSTPRFTNSRKNGILCFRLKRMRWVKK